MRQRVLAVEIHGTKRVFRDPTTARFVEKISGQTLLGSHASGKQMLFKFSGGLWLGVHLGMTGTLRAEPAGTEAGTHDHLVLRQRRVCLVFSDPRQFGRLRLEQNAEPPDWWTGLAPSVLSRQFSKERMRRFLRRKARAPVKSVLLMQEQFPGIGNWMADEILWRGGIFPNRRCGKLSTKEIRTLWRLVRFVSRAALATIGQDFSDPPDTWLFPHRWTANRKCPRDGKPLLRDAIGGRTTCWCPVCQPP